MIEIALNWQRKDPDQGERLGEVAYFWLDSR